MKRMNLTASVSAMVLTVLVVSGLLPNTALGQSHGPGSPTPDGYHKYMVFMANGVLPEDEVFIFGEDAVDLFHKAVMGRSDDEIAAGGAQAAGLFWQRFGIDVNDPRLLFSPVFFNPANNYRAYTVSGESVPSEGWVVRDGGWIVLTGAPLTLGGEEGFDGVEVPAGTIFLHGDYSIERTRPGRGRQPGPITLHYEAGAPVLPPASERDQRSFQCLLSSDDYGSGLAQGIVAPVVVEGIAQQNFRNVLTFSNLGGL
jgi:hypothetical protein